jgi:sugar lactone lactonase YvrE
MESIPQNPTTVLISDSTLGVVWRLDTLTGHFNIALDFPEMKIAPNASLAIGINGLRISKDTLYWTNSFERTIYRVTIDKNGSVAPGAAVETVVQIKEAVFLDDFAIGSDGIIWAAENVANRLFAVRPDGSYQVVEGGVNQVTVAGDTAAAFGKGRKDQKTLYVVTSGAQAGPVNGTYTEGGKVVAIDTSGY